MLSSREYLDEEDKMYLLPEGAEGAEPVKWGHKLMDQAIPGGIPIFSPGFHLIQGPSGSRKTTFALNSMINMHLSPNLPLGFKTFWWSVESFMTQEHVFSMIRAMLATKIIIYNRHNTHSSWKYILGPFDPSLPKDSYGDDHVKYEDACLGVKNRVYSLLSDHSVIPNDPIKAIWELKRDTVLTAQFIKSAHRWPDKYSMTKDMLYGYHAAEYCMYVMDIWSFGTSEHRNKKKRKARAFPANSLDQSKDKWLELAESAGGNCQFIVDHVTAFEMDGASDYDKQRLFKPKLKQIVDEFPILFWVIIQDGVGNQRDYERYGRVLGSSGGDVLKQESTVNWRKRHYDRDKHLYWDILDRPEKTRIGDHPSLAFMLAPYSGAYIGEAQLASEVIP